MVLKWIGVFPDLRYLGCAHRYPTRIDIVYAELTSTKRLINLMSKSCLCASSIFKRYIVNHKLIHLES